MKTGYYDLDKIIDLNKSQLIACSSADNVIETFFSNILKNISIDQKKAILYIDNYLMRDCSNSIKKEREILFDNKENEIEILPELIEVSDWTLDDIVSNMTMLNRFKILDNRIVEAVLSDFEIDNLKEENKIELIERLDGKEYIYTCDLFKQEERDKIRQVDFLLKSSQLFLKHIDKISLDDFKKMCYEYKNRHTVEIIILNNINTIDNSNKIKILQELQELSRKIDMPIIIGCDLIKKDRIPIENELESIRKKSEFLDTILFLKNGGEEDKNILTIWIMKNINNKLDKINLLYLDEYKKYINLAKKY